MYCFDALSRVDQFIHWTNHIDIIYREQYYSKEYILFFHILSFCDLRSFCTHWVFCLNKTVAWAHHKTIFSCSVLSHQEMACYSFLWWVQLTKMQNKIFHSLEMTCFFFVKPVLLIRSFKNSFFFFFLGRFAVSKIFITVLETWSHYLSPNQSTWHMQPLLDL